MKPTTSKPILAALATVLALTAALLAPAAAKDPGPDAENAPRYNIRPAHAEGVVLLYNLKLNGATAWTPAPKGVDWGKMETDFTFGLRGKTLRESGACTYELLGDKLTSVAEGPEGVIGIQADRERARIKAKGHWDVWTERTPLRHPMTATFGPRGAFRFGTGLKRLAIYAIPHVDHRFWNVLTVAPARPVAVGDAWKEEFRFRVPGAKGKPLELKAHWKVTGWERYKGQKVLALALTADLKLEDSNLILKNGDRVHVTVGTYKARGKVLWDVEHGVLCSARASQQVLFQADKPQPRALRSETTCTLTLQKYQAP
jgi:hypothetical protein